jgi:hypothetical protein
LGQIASVPNQIEGIAEALPGIEGGPGRAERLPGKSRYENGSCDQAQGNEHKKQEKPGKAGTVTVHD